MNFFDWLHDASKGEDTLRPKMVKVSIVIIVFIVLSILWSLIKYIFLQNAYQASPRSDVVEV